jgi:SAM-dependent methyltransferase
MLNIQKKGNISREFVVAAYKGLLNRDPENEEVIDAQIGHFQTVQDLLRGFVASPEFKSKCLDYASIVDNQYHSKQGNIDIIVPENVLRTLFARIAEQWSALGESEPYWSVLSDDRFRTQNIEKTKAEFYASGGVTDQLIDIFCERTHISPPTGRCLELGCGVGRVTRYLAKRFVHVEGVDISEGNLDLAHSYLKEKRVDNVSFLLLHQIEQLSDVEDFDFFFSVIVLQHNPPPIIAHILRMVLKKLRARGKFFFQVPSNPPGYQFSTSAYLESASPVGQGFEMHALPMYAVLEIIEQSGCKIKEVMADNWSGTYGSHTYFGVKA